MNIDWGKIRAKREKGYQNGCQGLAESHRGHMISMGHPPIGGWDRARGGRGYGEGVVSRGFVLEMRSGNVFIGIVDVKKMRGDCVFFQRGNICAGRVFKILPLHVC